MAAWWVYIVETDKGTLYTGITIDVARRFTQHRGGSAAGGARFFNRHHAQRVCYTEPCADRSSATLREMAIKKMRRSAKLRLIASRVSPYHDEEGNLLEDQAR